MVDGKFKCMGSVQHLKTKFGEGYTLTVKIRERSAKYHAQSLSSSSASSLANADPEHNPSKNKYINTILNELRGTISVKCKLKERNFNNVYQFELPCPSVSDPFSIGDIYRLIELNKLRFSIVDYSLSQNTLDNVFINFVKEQTSKKLRKGGGQNGGDEMAREDSDDESELDEVEKVRQHDQQHSQSSSIHFPIHDETVDMLLSLDDEDLAGEFTKRQISHNRYQIQNDHLISFDINNDTAAGSGQSSSSSNGSPRSGVGFRASALSQTIASRFQAFNNKVSGGKNSTCGIGTGSKTGNNVN